MEMIKYEDGMHLLLINERQWDGHTCLCNCLNEALGDRRSTATRKLWMCVDSILNLHTSTSSKIHDDHFMRRKTVSCCVPIELPSEKETELVQFRNLVNKRQCQNKNRCMMDQPKKYTTAYETLLYLLNPDRIHRCYGSTYFFLKKKVMEALCTMFLAECTQAEGLNFSSMKKENKQKKLGNLYAIKTLR